MAHGTSLRIARGLLMIAQQMDTVAEALVTPRQAGQGRGRCLLRKLLTIMNAILKTQTPWIAKCA
ncbi:hypothetical protein Rmet_6454 [Cupriavidus metallidurans CH34]|jgi:hypothetical protein|uniref:Uncharacterized protein n=3 Tax=Pseudomonadota TaxID=1224 RepID=D3DXP9_CUPMC|nr:hypothetical protein Rmet_6454 [Cupriavidus metallidurans CH34]